MLSLYPGVLGIDLWGSVGGGVVDPPAEVPICRIYGTLLNLTGTPAGRTVSSIVRNSDGTVTTTETWEGVSITLSLSVAEELGGFVIGTNRVELNTDEAGYFSINVLQGLEVVVTCPALGKTLRFATDGLAEIDISNLV